MTKPVHSSYKTPLTIGLAALLLLTIIMVVWQKSTVADLYPVGTPREVVHFWNADGKMSFTTSPDGDILIARHGQLLLADSQSTQYRTLTLSPEWIYHSPAFSPDGSEVAVVRQRQGGYPQIVVIATEDLKNANFNEVFEPIVLGENDEQFTDLSWSTEKDKLAYTMVDEQGRSSIWVVNREASSRLLTQGEKAVWSPDGTKLVVQRTIIDDDTNLMLIDLQEGTEMMLGQGEQPAWSNDGYLAFISTRQQEKVLTFMPDGSPQFTVHQRVGEIRSVYAGASGADVIKSLDQNENWLNLSTLLVSPRGGGRDQEMEWLKQMELQGIREPKVLLLDVVDSCHNPEFNSQGNILYFTRQDGAAAAVMKVDLEKRLINRGEN